MNYVSNLRNLICSGNGQVYRFISKEMRQQDDVVNGARSSGKNENRNQNERVTQLLGLGPTYKETDKDNGTTYLVEKSESSTTSHIPINNNPLYQPNMVDRLNTPFDYIDKILLQDFSSTMFPNGQDYFQSLFTFKYRKNATTSDEKYRNTYGITGFTMHDDDEFSHADYGVVNQTFGSGEFFLDSFTYTPFIDYSQTEYSSSEDKDIAKTGVYSDAFLNDYNCGRYEESYGDGKRNQVDKHRHRISSNLYTLRNLQKDICDEKDAFLSAITYLDDNKEQKTFQAYIGVFCKHLAQLFAKLSNIRMCHEIYGLKHPHRKWEGILALDIWYQLLYKNIDDQYPFDDQYMNMNPMTRNVMKHGDVGDYVEYDNGRVLNLGANGQVLENGHVLSELEWIADDTVDQDDYEQYVFVWDRSLWNVYNQKSKQIADARGDCVSPRGVLKKIYQIVTGSLKPSKSVVCSRSSGDFSWFFQKGKVYAHPEDVVFSKYTNLHLGLAYDVMSPEEYHELTDATVQENQYVKPAIGGVDDKGTLFTKMLEQGYYALEDAFEVIKNEKIFNIFNSSPSSNCIETFSTNNASNYSQAQCAIVIERVFSRLYQYLQFKSTTKEIFQRHINIDSGYKYLSTDSILRSDNKNSTAYYSEDDQTPYLRYLKILSDRYVTPESSVLEPDEKELVKKFMAIAAKQYSGWNRQVWNLCPLCSNKQIRNLKTRDGADQMETPQEVFRSITIDLNAGQYKQISGMSNSSPDDYVFKVDALQSGSEIQRDNGKPTQVIYSSLDEQFKFDLSSVQFNRTPQYTYDGKTVQYELVGFSTNRLDVNAQFDVDYVIANEFFGDGNSLTLYAIWRAKQFVVTFNPGDGSSSTGHQHQAELVLVGQPYSVPECQFNSPSGDGYEQIMFKYHNSQSAQKTWEDVEQNNDTQQPQSLYRFDYWEYRVGGSSGKVSNGGLVYGQDFNGSLQPVVTLTAKWAQAYNVLKYMVYGELYCEVLIDNIDNQVVYPPVSPTILLENRKFFGWESLEGEILAGIDDSKNIICGEALSPTLCSDVYSGRVIYQDGTQIICDNSGTSEIVCGGTAMVPVVCHMHGIKVMDTPINAIVVSDGQMNLTVVFKYLDENGVHQERIEYLNVGQNIPHIPQFHIHLKIDKYPGSELVFKYWKLVSGNISSGMHVFSDCVLVAVYDKIDVSDSAETQYIDQITTIYGQIATTKADEFSCEYVSDGENADVLPYCRLASLNPREYDNSKFAELICPFVQMFNQFKHVDGDFAELTMLEIEDITKLIQALFKVNIDIAHREYFLKIDVPQISDWWYGYEIYSDVICFDKEEFTQDDIMCYSKSEFTQSDVVCYSGDDFGGQWISFEPTVEFKFSNLHAANQVDNGRLVCTSSPNRESLPGIVPVNRELVDGGGYKYNDSKYFYDYIKRFMKTYRYAGEGQLEPYPSELNDSQKHYQVRPMCLYGNSTLLSPVDSNDFVRYRMNPIDRSSVVHEVASNGQIVEKTVIKKVETFTAIVKKYRPIIMPNVRDVFDDCINDYTRYEAEQNNDYGVFGWCTIPSKTMVNMEYNEQSIIVPSSYDCHNRVGGSNFLQMDYDFHVDVQGIRRSVYELWNGEKTTGYLSDNTKNTWYYLYNTRDWTYFLKPFFNVKQNSELYSYMLDTYNPSKQPVNSDHINGIIFEQSNERRIDDKTFGDISRFCQFLAKHHHNEHNLNLLAEKFPRNTTENQDSGYVDEQMMSFSKLKGLTQEDESEEFNSTYGSQYSELPEDFRFPYQDWVDDYDKTGTYAHLSVGYYKVNPSDEQMNQLKYAYNLGQAHSIDDFDEDSVWFYITMVEPLDDLNQVIEIEDIMPFVFWWENRGSENNGPTVDCYGHQSSAKLNYEQGGWCYSNAHERMDESPRLTSSGAEVTDIKLETEHRWHAVQHTLGVDFSKREYGGTILTTDNSGNVYKGAFDPNCAGTDEKWKIHHQSNAFGTNQHEDPTADKYYLGYQAHGDGNFKGKVVPDSLNADILSSIRDRPMTWNLWNVVRHYSYIRYFKNKHRDLGNDIAAWNELEKYTKKIVKGIYRTFKASQYDQARNRNDFTSVDECSTNYGGTCLMRWTNSFVEISTVLERNAREHQASFVLFTGDFRLPEAINYQTYIDQWRQKYANISSISTQTLYKMVREKIRYDSIMLSSDNFRVLTLEGMDDDLDGMRPRVRINEDDPYAGWQAKKEDDRAIVPPVRIYNGFKYEDMPVSFILGDNATFSQTLPQTKVAFSEVLDLDKEYPEAEYYLNNPSKKWIRRISSTIIERQMLPVYTSMETMTKGVHDLTVSDMKSITFQVVPQFYWKYEWSYNEFMIHRVGKLQSPSKDIVMYDMLGNVWEWVRDDWDDSNSPISKLNGKVNPIVGNGNSGNANKKVIRGGAFDQLCRKVISSAREGLEQDKCRSKYSTQENVGFRPSLQFTVENEGSSFTPGVDPIDLFFLFDASASQDAQIETMIESAKNIVKIFAGQADNKDVCHVGSALYLGPTIRMMCSAQCNKVSQTVWYESKSSKYVWGSKHSKRVYYAEYIDYDKNSPWDQWYDSTSGGRDGEMYHSSHIAIGRHDWIKGDTPRHFISGTGANGRPSGLLTKFNDFKQNVWMANYSRSAEIDSSELMDTVSFSDAQNLDDDLDIQVEYGDFDFEDQESTQGDEAVASQKLQSRDGPGCFVAGTPIYTQNGFVNIEDIKQGDVVVSRNLESGENENSIVLQTMVHDVSELIYGIQICGDTIHATGIHRFFVNRNGVLDWVAASDMVSGDKVMLSGGTWHDVDSISSEFKNIRVYNFEVSNTHNYYVGLSKILVHNKGGHDAPCFVAGTQVLLSDGTQKPIEQMQVGDSVLSYNEGTGENETGSVQETMTHDVDEDIYTFTIEGDELDVTGIHRFWIMRKDKHEWIPASELVVGDLVMFSDRSLHPISKISVQKLSTKVFNIEVTKNHNYYVSRNGVLVHNKDCFVAGTKVLVIGGKKNIEEIQVGEIVISYNEATGQNQQSMVVETMRHLVEREIFSIKVKGETIQATGVHRFYVKRNGVVGWVAASDISASDKIMLSSGEWAQVEGVEMEVMLTRVYNLHVSDNHNYYVGESELLAHNKVYGNYVIIGDIEYHKFTKSTKSLYVHCGVPAWKESSASNAPVHFGEIGTNGLSTDDSAKFSSYFTGSLDAFKQKYDFFTYDLTAAGISTFNWPFTYNASDSDNYRGVLSNVFCGCEPTCDMLSKILKDGFFFSFPWNRGIGYLFRKNTPKLVIVFNNEFDNSMRMSYTWVNGLSIRETVVLPGVQNKKLTLYTTQIPPGVLAADPNAPDPYCIQLLRSTPVANTVVYEDPWERLNQKFTGFYNGLQIDTSYGTEGYDAIQSAKWLFGFTERNSDTSMTVASTGSGSSIRYFYSSSDGAGISSVIKKIYRNPDDASYVTKELSNQMETWCYVDRTNKGFDEYDINDNPNPIGSMLALDVLTDNQIKQIRENGVISGVSVDNKGNFKSCRYDCLKTVGFYQLRNVIKHLEEPFNTYLFVSDANSPVPLYDVDTSSWTDADWANKDNLEKVAYSICLKNDMRLFQVKYGIQDPEPELDDVYLPTSINDEINTILRTSTRHTWKTLRVSNTAYHAARDIDYDSDYFKGYNTGAVSASAASDAKRVRTVFGLVNPYTRVSVVYARRDKWSKFIGEKSEVPWKNPKGITGLYKTKNATTRQYFFLLGLNTCMSPNGITKKQYGDTSWRKALAQSNSKKMISALELLIKTNVWGSEDAAPADWVDKMCLYSAEGESSDLSDAARNWIDKHLCPWYQRGWASRRDSGKMSKFTLDQNSMELIAVCFDSVGSTTNDVWTGTSGSINKNIYPLLFSHFCSAESFCNRHRMMEKNTNSVPEYIGPCNDDNYVLTTTPSDYVTITYRDGYGNPVGTLKIITLPLEFAASDSYTSDNIIPNNFRVYQPQDNYDVYYDLTNPPADVTDVYPPSFAKMARNYCSEDSGSNAKLWKSRKIVKFVKDFYTNIKKAMPLLMAYRYNTQIFGYLTNKLGKGITDYEDEENTIVAKSIPIMDISNLQDLFETAFTNNGKYGNFNSGKQFNYGYCIVDLQPDLAEYNNQVEKPMLQLSAGKFPMKFVSGINVNEDDEYKTSKIILSRIDQISGEKYDTFTMGSHASDYDLITDLKKRKYRDEEAIVDGAVDDTASVTLGNGGSYQKRYVDVDQKKYEEYEGNAETYNADFPDHPLPTGYATGNDLYMQCVPKRDAKTGKKIDVNGRRYGDSGYDGSNLRYEKKYFKNKQFFIDPFELTIAQWCYAKLNSTSRGNLANKASARQLLSTEGTLEQLEKQYWEYLAAWEKSEWNDIRIVHGWNNQETDYCVSELIREQAYNPLEDTRPYYHATYANVRKSPQSYQTVAVDNGSNFVIDSSKGDEFQMNSRTATESFMDILNNCVVYQTQKRIYGNKDNQLADSEVPNGLVEYYHGKIGYDPANPQTESAVNAKINAWNLKGDAFDSYGGCPIMPFLMNARDDAIGLSQKERKQYWCSKSEGGINFDLPTEAQWEYCCRAGSDYAVPPESNLGDTFEERNENLDLIAWYKYKVIGSLPEPERYCTWRISKMLFGISKDKEQINNVYEYFSNG